MKKLWLITKREFIVRVRKRSFILSTLLMPLAFALIIIIPNYLANRGENASLNVVILDQSGLITERDSTSNRIVSQLSDFKNLHFTPVIGTLEEWQLKYQNDGKDGLVYIPESIINKKGAIKIDYYSKSNLTLSNQGLIEQKIKSKLRKYRLQENGIDAEIVSKLGNNIQLIQNQIEISSEGKVVLLDKKSNGAAIATVLAYVMAFIIYIVLIVYGMQVLRSVMEEKTNRIVEVVISSVKPFQLMLGKILGVSGVGALQIGIWIVVFPLIGLMAQFVFGLQGVDTSELQNSSGFSAEQSETMILEVMDSVKYQNWGLIIPSFILFFLGGYFIYASMFAAVGSAVSDDQGESQTLTLPILAPIIISISFISIILSNPNGSMAVWLSMIPFLSPILMPARIPFDPPMWQIFVSLGILIVTAILFVFLAGRIYRIGILLYGKKVKFKDLWRWLFLNP